MPRRAASAASVSGCSAPSRNVNADCACSSTNTTRPRGQSSTSVIQGGEGPGFGEPVVGEAPEGGVREGDVPFVVGPGAGVPPVAGQSPGAGAGVDGDVEAGRVSHARGAPVVGLDLDPARR